MSDLVKTENLVDDQLRTAKHDQKYIIEEIDKQIHVSVFESFSEAQNLSVKPIHLILIDDLIIGTSSYELISFLRLDKKIKCRHRRTFSLKFQHIFIALMANLQKPHD